MKKIVPISFCVDNLEYLPIIDVRSPGEYSKGHIPSAHNIELFSDEERAIVGTAYKQESQERAIELGYHFVKPKLESFVEKALAIAPEKEVVVHCWRGGMRSNSFADHLLANGFETVYVIEKGYKAFRNHVLQFFEHAVNLKILGGYTGSGKTEILHFLEKKGQQVIDLEGMANHRGSAFGGIDLPPQPTTEHFENELFSRLKCLSASKPIWVEDESMLIGKVVIPPPFFRQMSALPLYFLEVPLQERIKHLVDTYSGLDQQELEEAIKRITKKLGNDKAKFALEALENHEYDKVVAIVLFYYDKYYLKGLQKRQKSTVLEYKMEAISHEETADFLISLINKENE
jgi:tRNA 2-selenouridine synthase